MGPGGMGQGGLGGSWQVSVVLGDLNKSRYSVLNVNLQLVPESYNLGGQGPKSFGHFFFNNFNASHFSVNDGLDKEDDLRFELKAWQLTRQKVGQKIRKKVWDDMDVKDGVSMVCRLVKNK